MKAWTAGARLLKCTLILLSAAALRAQSPPGQSPPIHGLAHIAIAVTNLQQSREFYNKLGFEEAFYFGPADAVTQSFIKINDRQFIELYPVTSHQPAGFLHLCFDTDDINALYAFYVARGLHPTPIRKAHAGNLLFTMEGPEHQNIEYTQYLPGSLHSSDQGRHLGSHHSSDSLIAVTVVMKDPDAARSFYLKSLGFTKVHGSPGRLEIPGSEQQLLIESGPLQSRSRAVLHVPNLERTAADLRRQNLTPQSSPHAITITDPDGNLVVFTSDSEADGRHP